MKKYNKKNRSTKKYIISKYLGFTISEYAQKCTVKILWAPLGPGLKQDITDENLFEVAADLHNGSFFDELRGYIRHYIKWIPYKLLQSLLFSEHMLIATKLLGGIPFNYVDPVNTVVVGSDDGSLEQDVAEAASILMLMKHPFGY